MLKNYLKSAIRFLKQNKVFAAINALGLSIALAASFIILLFVINELSYNHFHKKRDRVFRVPKLQHRFKDYRVWHSIYLGVCTKRAISTN